MRNDLKGGGIILFENVYLEIENQIVNQLIKNPQIGLEKDTFSLHGINIDLLGGEVEIDGFDKFKGEEFILYYHYHYKRGSIQYYNGLIVRFECK